MKFLMIMMNLFKISTFQYLLHDEKFVIEPFYSGNLFAIKILVLPGEQKKKIANEFISLIKIL